MERRLEGLERQDRGQQAITGFLVGSGDWRRRARAAEVRAAEATVEGCGGASASQHSGGRGGRDESGGQPDGAEGGLQGEPRAAGAQGREVQRWGVGSRGRSRGRKKRQ